MWPNQAWNRKLFCSAETVTCLTIIMQKLEKCCMGKPDASKVACPVWRGLGGNVRRKTQRAALPPYANDLVNADVPVTSIQKLLGHRWIESTQNYVLANDHQVQADYFAACPKIEGWS